MKYLTTFYMLVIAIVLSVVSSRVQHFPLLVECQKIVLLIKSGEEEIRYYKKSEASNMASCKVCGSSLFADKVAKGLVHIRLGSLVDFPSLKPTGTFIRGLKSAMV